MERRHLIDPSAYDKPLQQAEPDAAEFARDDGDITRPQDWDEYIGQTDLKKRLRVHAAAARRRQEPMNHVLLLGPSGCGKTSLASLIAKEADVPFMDLMCPISGEGLKRLIRFEGVVFLDEIHRSKTGEQEGLLKIVEDGYFQLPNGVKVVTPRLTLIAASTEHTKVIGTLKDRFDISPSFDEYTDEDVATIGGQMAAKYGFDLTYDDAIVYASAAHGKPRIMREFIVMARDIGEDAHPELVFDYLNITPSGLNKYHMKYMGTLADMGYRAGLDRLCAAIRMTKKDVEELEAPLVKKGFVEYDPKGRLLTAKGMAEIGEL